MNELLTIFTLINDIKLFPSDAVILLEGDGLNRIEESCKLILDGYGDFLVFSGGVDNNSNGSFSYENCKSEIVKYNLRKNQLILG